MDPDDLHNEYANSRMHGDHPINPMKSNDTPEECECQMDEQKSLEKPEISENAVKFLKAAEKGNLDLMKEMLQEDNNLLNCRDADDYTPLHRACYSNHPEVVRFLLEKGCDVSARTKDGWHPLHCATRWNCTECAYLLLKCDADVNAQTQGGLTPLHLAASNPESKEILEIFLLHPLIDPTIRNGGGEIAENLGTRHCSYYKLFGMCDQKINVL